MKFDTFIAANSAKGFFSYFSEFISCNNAKKVYLIKGGPGCGKSTFMKKIADKFADEYTVEAARCSSDCESLDGVFIKEKGVAIIDATPPHSFDMRYPAAFEQLLDFSKFWDNTKLEQNKSEIKVLTDGISCKYRLVYRLLKTAGVATMQKCMSLEECIDSEKANKIILKLIKQNAVSPLRSLPRVSNRMLSAFSKDGITTLSQTDDILCDEFIVISDALGAGYLFLNRIASSFTKLRYDVIKIHSPLLPELITEQVIVPQLRLGFICDKSVFAPALDDKKISKRINVKNAFDKNNYKKLKAMFAFEKNLNKDITEQTAQILSTIKKEHDLLENYYISATDYNSLNDFSQSFIKNI